MTETKQKFRDYKENFQRWYFKNHCNSNMKYNELLPHHIEEVFGWFNNLDLAFKWAVIEDFFEVAGIYPEVKDCHGHEPFQIENVDRYHSTCSVRGGKYYALSFVNEKSTARKEAFEKAIELYEQTEILKYL